MSTTPCRQESAPTSSGISAPVHRVERRRGRRVARGPCVRDRARDADRHSAAARPPQPLRGTRARARDGILAPRIWTATRAFAPLTAVMTVVIGFFLFSLATHQSDTVLAAQLTADHAKCFRLFAHGDSPDVDARRVEQMLEARLWVGPARAALVGRRRHSPHRRAPLPVRGRLRAARDVPRRTGTMCHSMCWMA